MSCLLHGNVWCTCRSSFPTNKELEDAHRAGKQLAEDVSNIGKPCKVCGSAKGHTTFDEFARCRNMARVRNATEKKPPNRG